MASLQMLILPLLVLVTTGVTPSQCQPTSSCIKQEKVQCGDLQASAERRHILQNIERIVATLGDIQREQRLNRDEIVCGKEGLYHTYNDTQYMLVLSKVTWREARVKCHMCGYRLAQIDSSGEHDSIRTWLNSNMNIITDHMASQTIWTDGTDTGHEGCWVWTSETVTPISSDVTLWWPSQPDNASNREHCKSLSESRDWQWNDVPCFMSTIYLCEKDTSQSNTINILPQWDDVISPEACVN